MNNEYCINCKYIDCFNKPFFTKKNIKDETIYVTCTCTKSNCNKKYCECYKLGEKCNINCRCVNCLNYGEEKNNKKKLFFKYSMERIILLIQNKKIYIDIKPIYEESNISFHNSSINTTFMVINEKK